jgi:hypothetical protein
MSAELKPCPFCGGKGGIRRSHDADGMLWVGCQCQSCGASTSQEWCSPGNDCPNFYESIRGRWNRRPELETSAALEKPPLSKQYEGRSHRGIARDWHYPCTDNDCWCWGSEHHNPNHTLNR